MPSDIQLDNEKLEREFPHLKVSLSQRLLHSLGADQIFRSPSGRAWVSFPCENETAVFLPLRGLQLRRRLFHDLHESRDEYPSTSSFRHALNSWDSVAPPLRPNPAVRV